MHAPRVRSVRFDRDGRLPRRVGSISRSSRSSRSSLSSLPLSLLAALIALWLASGPRIDAAGGQPPKPRGAAGTAAATSARTPAAPAVYFPPRGDWQQHTPD